MIYSDRVGIRQTLVTQVATAFLADQDLATVGVTYDQPGEAETADAVFFGDMTGSEEADTFGATSRGRTDTFTLEAMIATSGHSTTEAADERCQEILAGLCAALFESSSPAGFPSVAVYPGRLDGPYGFRPSPEQPVVSVAQMTITIKAPVRGS